ncbi:MAG: glycosyltransferase [Haloarculaceae archaeon]
MDDGGEPTVSFVVPARNEAAYLPATLDSIRGLDSSVAHEVVVVDGDSEDATPDVAREYGTRLVTEPGRGAGAARHLGAERARGDWLAFVDADTVVEPAYLETMLAFVHARDLRGAASLCRVDGPARVRVFEWLFNRVLPRLSPPPFPGFHVFVERAAYFDVGGFASGPNEDMTFTRRFGRAYPTDVCPEHLVETSGRRIEEMGLAGTLSYYTRREWTRQWTLRFGDGSG